MNFRTLDLNLLRVLEAMIRLGNVTRASEELGLSQPAVSAALARLRGQFGDPLFVRAGNGMVPTDRTEALAPHIVAALDALRDAIAAAEPFDPATAAMTFTLRGADFFSTRLMPELFGRLAREAPGIAIRFLDSARGDLVEMIESGDVDIALEQPMEIPSWVSSTELFASPFVIVAARGNPAIEHLSKGDALPLDVFCALPQAIRSTDGSMSGMTDDALAAAGRSRRVMLALPHFDAIMNAVSRSDLIAAVPVQLADEMARPLELAVFAPPFAFPAPRMQLYWHSRHDRWSAHLWLRGRVQSEVHRIWGPPGAPRDP